MMIAKKGFISLALRILIISLLLLAIPLILHTFWMYRQEYQESKKDLLEILKEEGEGRLYLLDQMVDTQLRFLKIVKENLPGNSEAGLNQFFHVWGDLFQASSLFLLQKEGDQLKCAASSVERMVGEDYSFLQKELIKDHFLFLGTSPHSTDKLLFVALTLYDGGKDPIGALVIGNPVNFLIDRLEKAGDVTFPLQLSLIDANGNVFASSDSDFANNRTSIGDLQKNYFVEIFPIKESGYSLLVSSSQQSIMGGRRHTIALHIYTFLFFFILVGGTLAFLFTFRLAKPMRSLYRVIDRISEGDEAARYQRDALGFEINQLGEHFNEMIVQVLEQREIKEELKIGHQIQKGMLPSQLPDIQGLDIATSFTPAKEVGGDFYDLFTRGKELVLAIADTSGKGLSACLYSLGMRSHFRSFGSVDFPLKDILTHSNQLFYQDAQEKGMFVTAWLAIYNPQTNKLSYSSAGHYPALLRKNNGEVIPLNTKGIALGATPAITVETEEITLEKGDLLLLYTDGVIDAYNKEGTSFGKDRLIKFLQKQKDRSSNSIANDLTDEIDSFTAGTEQHDDITFLVFQVTL